jgi:phage tail-like protein
MTDTIEQPEGGSNIVRKIASGVVKFDTLVVERDMDGSQDDAFFQDWFKEMFQLNGESGGSSRRRNGAVIKLENGVEVLRFAFYEAWVKSSKFADLEAATTNLFKQTVELEHNGLERVT